MKRTLSLLICTIFMMAAFATVAPIAVADGDAGTIVIDDVGGDCDLVGTWDDSAKKCTLTTDVFETVAIDGDGITLDGDGHSVTAGSGVFGIHVSSHSGNTIENVQVSGFTYGVQLDLSNDNTVTGSSFSGNALAGIHLVGSDGNTIKENMVWDTGDSGIWLESSDNNVIKENEAWNSVWEGIALGDSDGNVVIENEAFGNGQSGIFLYGSSDNNVVKENEVWGNGVFGCMVYSSNGNTVTENVALDNVLGGIWVYYGTSGNTLSENEISGSAWEGIRTYSSGGTTISGNVIMNNKRGILIWGNPSGNGNTAMGNTLESNTFGLTLSFGTDSNSVYHNNFVNNNIQAIDNGVGNQWDHGARGNYWSDYVGEDLDGDGIGDTPYTGIFGVAGSVDNYPLMEPY